MDRQKLMEFIKNRKVISCCLAVLAAGIIGTAFFYNQRAGLPEVTDTALGYLEAEDLGMALVKFSNGSYGLIEGTTNVYPKNLEETLYIFGEKGTAKAAGTSDNVIEEWNFADGLDDPDYVKETYGENPPNVYGFGHTPLYADVIDAINNHRQPYVTGEDGKRALEMILAIYKSAAEHRPVKLPLDRCSTMDFVGRFRNNSDDNQE